MGQEVMPRNRERIFLTGPSGWRTRYLDLPALEGEIMESLNKH